MSSQTSDSSDSCDLPAHRQKQGTKMPGTETQHKIFQESDPVEKVKLPITASAKQVGKDFSPERLTHDAEGNCRKTSVPQKSGKSVRPEIILSTRESFHSSSFNLISQKTKKHDGKSVSSSSEKTFQYLKGHDRSAKSNSRKEERKMESLPLKPTRLRKNRTASQDVNFRKSKSCQRQNTLQFSLPLLPQANNSQPAAKYWDVYWSPSSSANEGP